jgi:hypothetical protein
MRSFPRSVAWATLVPALLLIVLVPGCAKQDEGERCGDELGAASDVCDEGLTCTLKTTLINNGGDANRCCYSDGHVTDSRCELKGIDTQPTDAGDAGDTADAGDAADAGGEGN